MKCPKLGSKMKFPKPDAMYMQLSAVTMAWIAFVFTLISSFYCTFSVQDIAVTQTINEGNTTVTYPLGQFNTGVWNFKAYQTLYSTDGSGTLYINTYSYCSLYPEGTEVDAKWKTAQAFTIIATVLGGLVAIVMCTTCCDAPMQHWKTYAGVLLVTCISQGLALLFLNSNACAERTFDLSTSDENKPSDLVFESEGQVSSCQISSGGILAAVAICVWFIAAVCSSMGNKSEIETPEDVAQDVESGGVKDEEAEKAEEGAEAAKQGDEIAEQAPQVAA